MTGVGVASGDTGAFSDDVVDADGAGAVRVDTADVDVITDEAVETVADEDTVVGV